MTNTPEYRTIVQCTSKLTSAVQHDLSALNGELLAAGLISGDNSSALKIKHVAEFDRASDLVEFVRNKVQLDPKNYDKFIEVLKEREDEHKSILKILDEKYEELISCHQVLHPSMSVPATMCKDAVIPVDRLRSMSTPDGDAFIPWFMEKGMHKLQDHIVLKEHGVSPQCLSLFGEEQVADICRSLSIGGKVIFTTLCAEACRHKLQIINETPRGEAGVSTTTRPTQSGSQPTPAGHCVGNGCGPHIELDQRLDMSHIYMVSEHLRELPDETIRMLGGALGLSYPKLQRMKNLPEDMVAAWIRREDDVLTTIGEPTLRNLTEGLKQPGITQTGLVARILASKT